MVTCLHRDQLVHPTNTQTTVRLSIADYKLLSSGVRL